jgi:hypothetical protein
MLCSCSPDRGQTNAARQPQAHNVHAHARAHKKAEDRSIHLPRAADLVTYAYLMPKSPVHAFLFGVVFTSCT